jgi:broad specificity phosphatase PhoE
MDINPDNILVYVVRHGETVLNAKDLYRGPMNPELDAKGRQQAHELADFFIPLKGIVCSLLSSDKIRSLETANVIGEAIGLKPLTTDQLEALNVGHLGGQPRTEENKAEIAAHLANPNVPIKGGESFNHFKIRVVPVIRKAMEYAIKVGHPVIIVAHSSIIHEVGTMFEGIHNAVLVKPGGVVAIYYTEDKSFHAKPIFKPDLARIQENAADAIT